MVNNLKNVIYYSWSTITITITKSLLTCSKEKIKSNHLACLIFSILFYDFQSRIQFVWKLETERTTDHGQATGKLYHLRLRVECDMPSEL
jgi:hypothetical protein